MSPRSPRQPGADSPPGEAARLPLPITAWTLYTALGRGARAHLDALSANHSGLAPPSFDLPFTTEVGAVSDALDPLPASLAPYDTRLTRLAAAMADDLAPEIRRAVARWGAERIGLFLGTSTAGILRTERAWGDLRRTGALDPDYQYLRQHAYDSVLAVVGALTGVRGPAWVVSTACSSSSKVFGSAQRLIESGVIDAALVGGVDTLCQTTLRGFQGLGVLSDSRCQPLSSARKGINIGEGGGLMLLERGGEGRTSLLGVGESADAHHISAPHPQGEGAYAAMAGALEAAGIAADAVDYINAHGTGTLLNDSAECAAIARLFGGDVPVTSTKARTGHLLGACGVVEAAFALSAIETGSLPPSLGADPLDGDLGVFVPTTAQSGGYRVAMSNTFAFGGNNVSVVLGGCR